MTVRTPTGRPSSGRSPGIALRLLTALPLAIMFALVKLASTRGVNVVESLFYRQCGSALCAAGLVAARPRLQLAHRRSACRRACRADGAGRQRRWALNFVAFILLPLAEATTIGFSVPIFSVVLAAWCSASRPASGAGARSRRDSLGVLLIVQPGSGEVPLLGASVALVAALADRFGDDRHPAARRDRARGDDRLLVRGELAGSARAADALVRRRA